MVKIASTMEAAANFFLLLLSLVSSRVTVTAFSSFLLFDEDGGRPKKFFDSYFRVGLDRKAFPLSTPSGKCLISGISLAGRL